MKTLQTLLYRLLGRLQRDALAHKYISAEPPLRAELFSADQMERHGKTLAEQHQTAPQHGPDKLLARLVDNESILVGIFSMLTEAAKAGERITPAGEWLLDNFYLVEEQIRIARKHFPKGYSRELPLLGNGPSQGLPRVYDIALESVAHGDGRVDPESLNRFVAAYQTIDELRLGELWAIPIMLRLALIENLRRVGSRVVAGMIDRRRADAWADQMIEVAEKDPKSLILVISDMARSNPPLRNSFVAELARRLQGQSSALALPLTWIEQRLSEAATTIEQMVQSETQSQASHQVSISHSIGSLRALGATDWREFVETMSAVERELRHDRDGLYAGMDFASRDRYRHVIEHVARHSRCAESEVARDAIRLAAEAMPTTPAEDSMPAAPGDKIDPRRGHVGYYLIGAGLPQLEQLTGARLAFGERVRRLAARRPLLLYLGAIALLSAACTGGFLAIAAASAAALWVQALIFVPALLASSQLAVTLVNWLVTLLATPLPLPRMDYSLGIPAQSRTLVVVPTMLVSLQGVDDLVEALEVRFLANRDTRLHFGLLTDFGDAASELQPEDDALLQAAGERVAALNAKYDCVDGDTFFLFHRPRRWNASEKIWMGYERKRGKLGDLNALLRSGADSTAFSLIVGATAILGEVRYVITLDTDTQLPRDCARALAGAMAHPLNRPCLDPASRLVTAGYGILQPRMAVNLPSTNRSRYARLSGADAGIDPYTRAISDVYQDLFHEGSFIGKGIYDVDAFEGAVKERFPDNRILSHDLLEGCYARAGLLSDVQLYEDTPARYGDDVSRRHRWIRGDWQIASWLLSLVPAPAGQRRQNPLSTLSQWKLFDNLRRSLVPAAVCLLFLLGWILVPSVLAWTLAVLGILFLPLALNSGRELLNKQPDVLLGAHFSGALRSAGRQFAQAAFALACLPYEAWYSLDAIVRTATRLVSRRRMLEWRPSHDLQSGCGNDAGEGIGALAGSYRRMWPAPLLAVVCVLALATPPLPPLALLVLAPLLTLWLGAPAIAWWLSRPTVRHASSLRPEQTLFLYKLARKTWRYFETFVNAMEHWLPPDNYQEQPLAVIAHRTSPTNMGLALLANLSAYDFGYITAGKLLERSRNTLQTMLRLERYQSHFYNWYDTLTLRPLSPLYVSSVDSGNLSGHLLTLRPGLLELADRKILGARTFPGLRDTLAVLSDCTGSGLPELTRLQQEIEQACAVAPAALQEAQHCLERLTAAAALIAERLDAGSNAGPEQQKHEERGSWADALHRQCQEALDELRFLAPWIQMVNAPGDGKTALDEALRRIDTLSALPTLRELAMLEDTLAEILDADLYARMQPQQRAWLAEFRPLVALASLRAGERLTTLEELARLSGELAAVDNGLLYDNGRHLMALGFKVEQRLRDKGNYDLLASEARLSSFVAIAQGAVPQESWFALGRMLTTVPGGDPILLSWSGSMFEYLMPMLVMPSYENTLIDQTCRAAVQRQIAYGKQRSVPWGISESGYNTVDAALNYQYRAFGVPGLGLKRGLAEDLVIAPYASALALMVMPEEACANLQRLTEDGLQGHYGMYEALDFTPSRVPRGQTSAIVRSFMAHHQGMSLLSFAYLLLGQPMQKRFESDPLFQATTLLLQERIPAAAAFHFQTAELADLRITSIGEMPMRVLHTADTPTPEVQLLSNGRYHVMVSNAGGGYSRWKDFAVTRWREDATCDHWGSFCYLRDPASGAYWSSAHQPTRVRADTYEAIFSESRAEFRRLDHAFETHTEIVVSPEDDIELRRMRITNRSDKTRMIEVTSYAEVVLTSSAADALHPAFSNLFVQSEILADRHAILCTRRPRSADEKMPWMFHLLAVHGAEAGSFSYETDRMRFIGRTRDVGAPQAMQDSRPLSGSQGAVLDPVVAIRTSIRLGANETATVDLVCGIGETREAALELVGKYRDRHLAGRVFDLACTHSWVNLQQINASEADAQLYSQLAGSVIYASAALRADATVLARNRRGQSGLWAYAVSGDLPIVLLQIGDLANIELVRQLVQAHTYWRQKGLIVDLVIWNEDHAGYRQLLQEQIMGLIASVGANLSDRPGGIFVRAAEQISVEDRTLFQTVARAIITDSSGTLAEQMNRRSLQNTRLARIPRLVPRRTGTLSPHRLAAPHAPADALRFFNGLGGFSANGREYVISTTQAQASPRVTPAPWVNVIANARFGTVISESGASYTWSENAHEFRFTPWGDDPVSDVSGEAIYLRDEESGAFWSPTALPCGGEAPYRTRHGFGYSIFEHEEDGIVSQLTVHVDSEASVKFSELTLLNRSGRTRRLSATGYVEWVLGDLRPKSAMHIVSEIDADSGALCARNRYSGEFADRIAFFDADSATRGENVSFTADRNEFLGRNGTLRQPAAMARSRLSNKLGAGLDPCAAMQVPFTLADGQSRQIIFRLGAAGGRRAADARDLMQRLRGPEAAKLSLTRVHAYWAKALGAVEVTTPDPALDLLANGWLLYQTIACRLWARSGYYQSGGAFGFRDQLQDTMALVHTQPQLLRQQVLSCAGRQFSAGDVQHWWHPPSGRGVRTHCSDDYLWLAQATCRYVRASGDLAVLDESAQFLEGRALNPEEDSYYDLPGHADSSASLYQHCVRAIEHGLNFGKHGLPLMGSGDWNDGMNLVGIKGRGESVWLGFFLYDTLLRFADLAQAYGDETFAERCRTEAVQLRRNIDKHAWDGGWYRRAWFDDGSRLGSAGNSECRIDSIAQSWSVLSGAGSKARSRTAMAALDAHLVRREHALVQLLDPPFDKATLNPGYIKGYVPGVRENGGQYTHAAIWASMAFAALGDRQRAWELFDMINPLRHGDSAAAIATYKVEPYVMAADVYFVAPHIGRGGWTWYTGSAGWMYRLIVESLLGIELVAGKLRFAPCLPADWSGYTLSYRYGESRYLIIIEQAALGEGRSISVSLDGLRQADADLTLVDDQREHRVEVRLPSRAAGNPPAAAATLS